MLKKILNVKGTKELDKKEQSQITGGVDPEACTACGGFSTPGNCFGDVTVCICLYGLNDPRCGF